MNRTREWYRVTHLRPRLAPGLCDSVEIEPVEAIEWNPDTMPIPKVRDALSSRMIGCSK